MMPFSAILLALLPCAMGEGQAVVPKGTLYCFACVTPNTYEVGMIAAMARLGLGLFECNGYDIISNTTADQLFVNYPDVAGMLKDKVHVIHKNLYVPMVRGPAGHDSSSPQTDPNSPLYEGKQAIMKHLVNAPVFKDVWQSIFAIGAFENFDYTCKLDVDAVIVPGRLSGMLSARPVEAKEYFLNAYHDMYGNFLHGPVELISKMGMYVFRDTQQRCYDQISLDDYGEDFWANKCWSLLKIPQVPTKEMPLLYDEYEWGASAKNWCWELAPDPAVSTQKLYFGVYHPRKNMADWLKCREQTGVPTAKFISQEQKQMAIQAAGPGKPTKIIGMKYEMSSMPVQWSLPLAAFVSVGIAGVALVALGAFALRKWSRRDVCLAEAGLIEELE